jgi:release factor glutamine methyltransferase
MSVNLLPQPPSFREWLIKATAELRAGSIPSPRLDAEIILAHTLRKSRTYLHSHLDDLLTHHHFEIANARIHLRLDRTPVAYIIGHKEFYGRNFKVSPATLIPRPESEDMITLLKEYSAENISVLQMPSLKLIDVGTGSGCLGISAKLELPELDVTLSDTSRHALSVAEANAASLGADVTLTIGNLLSSYPLEADYILANLPYVDESWERSPETNYEPAEALFAPHDGLALIFKLIDQALTKLSNNGCLLLEADTRQHVAITSYAKDHGFSLRDIRGLIITFAKS